MSLALTAVTGAHTVWGNKRVRVYDVVASSTYPDGGESLTAADVGLKKIDQVLPSGPALSTDRETANPVSYDFVNSTLIYMEGAASGAAIAEKTDSEAHATGSSVRITFIGY